ncbi:uncharacterized protein H6S33_010860 [Morchella sextelata]|uniref:uncharacterized protein n=1 Tax=Morchella sextelata TaxID=1174677 RepID=UPI001D0366A9|nr:uncharacterized protein H6S33_010860 [Morchella sextelata]KAH0611595.1 hypothetical protein H6S33_010860 [Morchella sextelata]
MTLDCTTPSPTLEQVVLKEQTIFNPPLSMRKKERVNGIIAHIIPPRDVTQRIHQYLRPTIGDSYEVKAGILVDDVLYTNKDMCFIVDIERILTRMSVFLGITSLKEVLELEVISFQYQFLDFNGLLDEYSTISDILHKNMFHLKQTNLRCGCVILPVFAMHMRHPSEGQYRNPIQKILSRRVAGDPKDAELKVLATLSPSALESGSSVLEDSKRLEIRYSSLQPIPPGFSQHRQTRSPQAVNYNRRGLVVPSPIEIIKISMYKPAVDLKAGSYTPTKSVSFLSSKDIKPGENMQRHLSPDPTEPNHPGIEAICFRIVKRKHSDVARDPSRPFCDMRTELKIEKDMNPRIFTRKIPRNPVYPCPPPPPNTPTGAGSQPNIETLAMELHVALTKIKSMMVPLSNHYPCTPPLLHRADGGLFLSRRLLNQAWNLRSAMASVFRPLSQSYIIVVSMGA